MLHRILQSHGGKLPDDVIVCFANTGKEMNETLDFVEECSQRWSVPITWLEYRAAEKPSDRWCVVDHASASRNGEPFEAVIGVKTYLPNPVTRFCTSELKVNAMRRYIIATHGWDEWVSVVGIRADEPRRLARIAVPNRDRDERYAPLGVAGIGAPEVGRFWADSDFDLRLPNRDGKTLHGNCDLCFLKGAGQLMALIREQPERAVWWAAQEERIAVSGKNRSYATARFRSDRPGYAQMHSMATQHGELFAFDDESLQDCMCTD
jgi:3'-phosphoadenosine 5'-phosphosulfate sulfotransferase (PAPS reductase)/FAD synthetase